MIKYLTILWIAAAATVAQAEDDRGAGFRCGLKMGGGQGAEYSRLQFDRTSGDQVRGAGFAAR